MLNWVCETMIWDAQRTPFRLVGVGHNNNNNDNNNNYKLLLRLKIIAAKSIISYIVGQLSAPGSQKYYNFSIT